jgi:DNA polymerase-3 subunit epsilon
MSSGIDPLEELAQRLEVSDDFRVLRRLKREAVSKGGLADGERVAVIVDTETTGLDLRRDEVIEIALLAVAYDEKGRITRVLDEFEGIREPSVPISSASAELTGITTEMVRGKRLEMDALEAFLAPAVIVVAHNAAFDRPMCERLSHSFASKSWACSATQLDWRRLGFEGRKLVYLLNQFGLFHDGHRAMDDAQATLQILKRPLADFSDGLMPMLLTSARIPTFRYWVQSFPELASDLRKRGYRWLSSSRSHPRSWTIDVLEDQVEAEEQFLMERETNIRRVSRRRITAVDRFKLDL